MRVDNVAGCTMYVPVAGACVSQKGGKPYEKKEGNCRLVFNRANAQGVGSAVIYSPQAPAGLSYTYWKCKPVDEGGKQCAPVGGGCSVVGGSKREVFGVGM